MAHGMYLTILGATSPTRITLRSFIPVLNSSRVAKDLRISFVVSGLASLSTKECGLALNNSADSILDLFGVSIEDRAALVDTVCICVLQDLLGVSDTDLTICDTPGQRAFSGVRSSYYGQPFLGNVTHSPYCTAALGTRGIVRSHPSSPPQQRWKH